MAHKTAVSVLRKVNNGNQFECKFFAPPILSENFKQHNKKNYQNIKINIIKIRLIIIFHLFMKTSTTFNYEVNMGNVTMPGE